MDQEEMQVRAQGIFNRAKAIIMQPSAEWAKIATETDQPMSVFLRYALPLIALGPIAGFIGGQVFGIGGFGINIRIGLMTGLTMAIVGLVLAMASVWLLAFVANFLSPKFGGKDDFAAAFRLIAYSWTAAWVVGIFGLIPMLGILGILGLYSLYLLYLGVTPVMGVPQDKAVGYTVATVVVAIVCYFIVGAVAAAITAPMMVPAMGSGADGTMTITGPDGEEVTFTVDSNKSE